MRTSLCDLLAIEHPVIQASLGPWSSVALTAAVSEAGPAGPGGYEGKTPRVLRTEWVDRYNADPEAVAAGRGQLAKELVQAVRAGRGHELVPFTGQTTGMIKSVEPAGEIVVRMVAQAEELLARYP